MDNEERLRRAIEKMAGSTEDEIQELAQGGKRLIETYCAGGLRDIETIEAMAELDDLSRSSNVDDRQVVINAHFAAANIAQNFAHLSKVLAPLAMLAIRQQSAKN